MGADGGINYVIVTGDRNRFQELIAPFYLGWSSKKDEHDDYLKNHDFSGQYYISTYGTDQTDELQGMDTLERMLDDAADDKYKDMTFYDLILDCWTCSEWTAHDFEDGLGAVIKCCYCDYMDPTIETPICGKEKYHSVLEIKIHDWRAEVIALINTKSFGSIETWT